MSCTVLDLDTAISVRSHLLDFLQLSAVSDAECSVQRSAWLRAWSAAIYICGICPRFISASEMTYIVSTHSLCIKVLRYTSTQTIAIYTSPRPLTMAPLQFPS